MIKLPYINVFWSPFVPILSISLAIAGYKGSSQIDEFRQALKKQTSNDDYCQVEFLQLDYDQADGTAVFNSLEKGITYLNKAITCIFLSSLCMT